MTIKCIDIASWQAGIDPGAVDCDAVIIKVSGGTSYENPYWRQWADATLAAGKLLAFYHYACEYDSEPGGRAEAEFFWDHVKDYAGKFIPILDWEAHALDMPVSYAKDFLDRIVELSGATPWFYGYASNVNSTDYSSIAHYPLWMASYLYRYDGAGWVEYPDQTWDSGAWDSITAYQYTSTGWVAGYGSNLDLSVFYGTRDDWAAMCGGGGVSIPALQPSKQIVHINPAHVAAIIHADMCDDDDNGYCWYPRNGEDGAPIKQLWIDGLLYEYDRGSYDCSSSVCKAWQEALRYTPYAGALDGATYTGNMRPVFESSGLFYSSYDWASRGDVYLNDEHHTAMCQDGGNDGIYGYDALSEFCIGETGDVYGNEPGDQTGYEAYIHEFYEYWAGWNETLHYNHAADCDVEIDGAPVSIPSGSPSGDVDDLARAVIRGEYGNGDARRAALGSRYDEVQARVNEILGGGGGGQSRDIESLAWAVIRGEYGNGYDRMNALGDLYDEVQARVNEILEGDDGGSNDYNDIDDLAWAVIRGDYGNGEERREALGDLYDTVQARVNELLG